MPEVYSRSSDALLRRLLSRKGFTPEDRRSLLRQVRERGSVYLAPINAVYVRKFSMTSSAEDATRFLHQACRSLPNRRASKPFAQHSSANGISGESVAQSTYQPTNTNKDDAFYITVLEHALAFFGSRILYPARPALRDNDLAALLDVTREDLEQETSLPFADAVDALQFLTQHRQQDFRSRNGSARSSGAIESIMQVPAFTGRKYDYVAQRLGYLTGTDLYDAYLEGRLSTTALRKLFLTHIERPRVARETYVQLAVRLRSK
jgi:hypothetical protein